MSSTIESTNESFDVKQYKICYLVGNQYCDKKPCKLDIMIKMVPDTQNIYDNNAIKVVSIVNDKEYKLGYVSKFHNENILNKINHVKVFKILKFKKGDNIYYHILYNFTCHQLHNYKVN